MKNNGNKVKPIDWLAIINKHLTRYDLGSEPYYGDPCMEPEGDGDYVHVWDLLEMLKSIPDPAIRNNGNKIYLLTRKDRVGYDEYTGFVIVAGTEEDARTRANSIAADEGPIWAEPDFVKCEEVNTETTGIVLDSFNAG